jgi:hypothetical protein
MGNETNARKIAARLEREGWIKAQGARRKADATTSMNIPNTRM